MYLDDGVSRSSAPRASAVSNHPDADADPVANSEYREVLFHQQSTATTRIVAMTIPHDGYGTENVKRDIGDMLTFVLWHDPDIVAAPQVEVSGLGDWLCGEVRFLHEVAATIVKVPVDAVEVGTGKLVITVRYK